MFQREFADVVEQVGSRVGESGENNDLLVVAVQRIFDFLRQCFQQYLQFGLVVRRDVRHGIQQGLQNGKVFLQITLPCEIVHVRQCELYLLAHGEQVGFLIIRVKVSGGQVVQFHDAVGVVIGDGVQCGAQQVLYAL